MERTSPLIPIRRLLHAARPPGGGVPLDLADLAGNGVDAKAASFYARRGWLDRVGHGVYALPGDEVQPLGAAQLLQRQVEGLHIGGKSALALQGVRHTLAVRETLVLWADQRFALPKWFASRFPSRAVFAALFDNLDPQLAFRTIATPPGVRDGLHVSTPERAMLELLYEVGTHESLDEARGVFEGLSTLRTEVVGGLLSACTSVKAVRLFLTWSRETGLLDVDALRERFALRVGSESRWVSRMPDGTLLLLKPYG